MTKVLRVGGYVRVSKRIQDPALQESAIKAVVEQRAWNLVELYVDHGVSGSRDRRPELDRLMADARRGRLDAVVVYKADRLFRSLKAMVVTLDELTALHVGFISTTEMFDTTTPQGKLFLQIVGAFAEFERGILIERTVAGMEVARKKGARIGRPSRHVDLDRARSLRAEGRSLRLIAAELSVSLGTLHKALTAAGRS